MFFLCSTKGSPALRGLGGAALVLSLLAYGQGRASAASRMAAFDAEDLLTPLFVLCRPPGLASVLTALGARDVATKLRLGSV